MINTFEKNDAGFQYVIDKKGIDDYSKYTSAFKEKAIGVSTKFDCQKLMNDWLHYFRPGHIGVFIKEPETNSKENTDAEIRLSYKDEKTIDITEKQLTTILGKKKNINLIEGIWSNANYTIGIIGDENSHTKFTAFIIHADSVYWIPKQIKAELTSTGNDKAFSSLYYKRNHSAEAGQAKLINNEGTLLLLNDVYWTRIYPAFKLTKKDELLVRISDSRLPFVEKLSDQTIYLRIPSFQQSEKVYIDSVLKKYHQLITSTPNLIIDIRNGTGGSDDAYKNIIPYLYTNPIREVGLQLYATELNAKAYERVAKQYADTENINYCNNVAKRMRENIGKFITTSNSTFSIDSLNKIVPLPSKVAIICNQNNGSTDEQFLIAAKQSRKVKVFGHHTGGMLDISNMNFIDFPDNKFGLAYCMSKSFRIPNYCIDGIGIQPDYFIDDAVSEDNWIEFTKAVLEQ
jgi:hypothetical protein